MARSNLSPENVEGRGIDLALVLLGKNGKKQGMDNEVFEIILKITKTNSQKEYSDAEAKALNEVLREAVTHYPYNRQTTRAALLGVARFFRTCKGFTVEEWRPSAQPESSNEKPLVNPRVRELRETIMRKLAELEKRNESSGQG